MTNISGFPEFLPNEQLLFYQIKRNLSELFLLHGMTPLETSAVERVTTLLSKGNDNEIYGLHRLAADSVEQGKRNLALRFDLTVPLARYVAQHNGQIHFPFRRYQIAPVWRGERPQNGRYRQFHQCDIDIIGSDTLAVTYDAEVIAIAHQALKTIGITDFVFKINDRSVLTELLLKCGFKQENLHEAMRLIDKKNKESADSILDQLVKIAEIACPEVIDILLNAELTNDEWLAFLHEQQIDYQPLVKLADNLRLLNVAEECIAIAPYLARGLSYYTGMIFETTWRQCPEIGSICSGGRYDNLSSHFGKRAFPGVGMSIGLSRLVMQLLKTAFNKNQSSAKVWLGNNLSLKDRSELATILRSYGIAVEVYHDTKKLSWQIMHAARLGIEFVVIAGNTRSVTVRNVQQSRQYELSLNECIELIKGE